MNEDECVATDSIVLIFVVRLEVALLEIREQGGRHDFNRPCVTVSFRFPHSAFGPTLMIFISSLGSAVYVAISVRGPGSNFRMFEISSLIGKIRVYSSRTREDF